MELSTDIMAIIGFVGFGRVLPVIAVFLGGGNRSTNITQELICAFSLGLIAASFVLG